MSTLVAETWVVSTEGCTDDANEVPNCPGTRGELFNKAGSTTWEDQQIWPLVAETNLGFSPQNYDVGDYGYDTLGIFSKSIGNLVLDKQVVAVIATKDFYLGNLGLSPRAVNPNINQTSPSFLKSLKSQNKIPSLSYGYTAGAAYSEEC